MRTLFLSLTVCTGTAAAAPEHPDGDPVVETRVEAASKVAVPDIAHAPRGAGAGVFVFTGDEPEGDAPSDIVFADNGETIVVAHRESGNLILWDADTRIFLGQAAISGAPQAVDVTPDGSTAVVASINTESVSIVDLDTLTETAVIGVGRVPGSVSINPSGTAAAVHAAADGVTSIIDIASASVVQTIPGIGTWSRISFSFEAPAQSVQYGGPVYIDDTRLFNVDLGADEVQFITPDTGAVDRIAVADSPFRFGISDDGTTAVVGHSGSSRTLTIIDLATQTVTGTLTFPFDLSGPVAVNADATRAVVAVQNAARVVDLTDGSFGFELNTASNNDLVSNHDGTRAIGIGFRGPVIDFETGALLANANQAVSCEFGVASPFDDRVAMCSTTFGDDLVVLDTDETPALEAFQRSGPIEEGDRARTAAISADGSVAVAVSIFSDTATIIDVASGGVTGFAPLGERPSGVAITPDGTTAVVANLDSTFASVVDLATATTTEIPISRRAGQVEISPDGQYAYLPVVASGDGVWRINLDTLSVEGPKLLTGNMGGVGYSFGQTSGIALSNDGARLAVAGSFDDVVTIIDTDLWSVEADVAVGDFPTSLAFSPDDQRLYVSNKNDDSVSIIDLTTPTPAVVNTVSTSDQPWQLVPDPDGQSLYVNMWGDSRIGRIDLGFPVLASSIAIPDSPTGLALDPAAGLLYVASGTSSTTLGGSVGFERTEDGRITVIDTASFTAGDTIELGLSPSALAADRADAGEIANMIAPAPTGDGAVLVRLGGPCNPADLAEPFGVLDLADITAFVTAFQNQDAPADLAEPFGVWDLADVQSFVVAFNGGCP